MARWQYVETSMFILAHAIMRTEYKYSSSAFYMLKGADMKQQLLSRLCEAYFSAKILEQEWKPLKKEILSAIRFRNGLAHFEVNFMPNRAYLGPHDPPVVLSVHHLDYRENLGETVRAANTSELHQAASEWLILAQKMLKFVRAHFSLQELSETQLPHRWLQLLWNAPDSPNAG